MGLQEFWLGVGGHQRRERLRRIRDRIYTTVAELDATILTSAEPIAFADLDRSRFRPVRPGTAWGGKLDCAWLHLTGSVPEGVTDPLVMLGIRGEGLVYSPHGEVVDAVSTVFLQGDLPHAGRGYRVVRGLDLSGGRVDLYADVAYNGFLMYDVGRGVYRGARIAVRDEVAFGLYYDYLTLVVLAANTEDRALAADLEAALDQAWEAFSAGDLAGARGGLAELLAQRSTSDFHYAAVGHGHLDMAWLWPLRETRRKAARTYANALNNIAERPGHVYGTSQMQQLWWMKQEQPALFARLKDAVAAGRIELQGAFWVEPDTNLPSGESLVRQALVGRRFQEAEFGLTPDRVSVCWLPDTFGYNGNLPQILAKAGMDKFLTIKLSWNRTNLFPYRTFTWEGIDGSSVLVHMPPEGDYNSRAAADGLLRGVRQYPERDLGTALLVYGAGDGGGGPGEVHLELLAREHDLRGLPTVEFSTAEAFFADLATRDIEHRHAGELYLETHQGTYTTQAAMKAGNRRLERLLHNAEALAVITGDDSREPLAQPWRDVLLHQFHDILPGSSITRVHAEARDTYVRLAGQVGGYIDRLTTRLAGPDAVPAAINLTGFPRAEYVRHADTWYRAEVAPYAAAALRPAGKLPGFAQSDDSIGNGLLTLRFDEGGEIVSCLDADGGEHAAGGLNRLVLHSDPFQFPFNAWDIDPGYHRKPGRTQRADSVRTMADGPTITRRSIYRLPHGRLEQDVVLEAGSPLVRIDTRVEWGERLRMLRAEFRPVHYADQVRCEIQFGHISRPTTERDSVETAQFEVCAHRWIATEDAGGGFAVVNDSKYGHRAKNGLISLNLLRSPVFPDRTADRGHHEFSYGFLPFAAGGLTAAIQAGYRLNNPLLVGDVTPFASLVAADNPAVVVDTVKISEDGSGVVVRAYESLGSPARTRLTTTLPHTVAVETDLLERPIGPADLDALEFGRFEVKTIVLAK